MQGQSTLTSRGPECAAGRSSLPSAGATSHACTRVQPEARLVCVDSGGGGRGGRAQLPSRGGDHAQQIAAAVARGAQSGRVRRATGEREAHAAQSNLAGSLRAGQLAPCAACCRLHAALEVERQLPHRDGGVRRGAVRAVKYPNGAPVVFYIYKVGEKWFISFCGQYCCSSPNSGAVRQSRNGVCHR